MSIIMHKKTIYFNQKSLHRERQADTAKYAAEFFDVISPLKKQVDNIKTFNKVPLYFKIIAWLVAKIPTINIRKMPKMAENADYIYTRWDIPLFPKKPFVIELDNPYILTFYNYFAFKLYKPIIKWLLNSKKCKKIVCISEACRQTFLKEMGGWFEDKTVILYPRMKDLNQNINRKDDKIKFIFVWLQARLKWLYELLEAFHKIDSTAIVLEVIWVKDIFLEKKYHADVRIQFLWQIPRKDIVGRYLPWADVLVFPTYFESFGIVALEALSCGLWIITTNLFALPEVCKDGYNGKILKHPYFQENELWFVDINKVKMTISEFNVFLDKKWNCDIFEKQISLAISAGIHDYKHWKQHSKKLYNDQFSQKKWSEIFISIFK